MSDLVKRLREGPASTRDHAAWKALGDGAANRIEALETALKEAGTMWIRKDNRIEALEAALERSVSRGSDAVVQIATLSHALREIAQKRKLDAVAATSMQAIALAALAQEQDNE